MINPTGKKLEKLLFGIFDDAIQGVDRYNHNGSLWLIFTDEMRWVVEYTKTQTLWYNYYFFKNEMEMVGLDCVDNKDLIQKWFESRFLNMGEVQFADYIGHPHRNVYDTIQNGVKETRLQKSSNLYRIEDTIQEGVKDTHYSSMISSPNVDDTIQNGVKDTKSNVHPYPKEVRDTIQNGVKNTENFKHERIYSVDDTIQNGVKETTPSGYLGSIEMKGKLVHQIESPKQNNEVEDTIQNGVKETCKSESTKSISLRRTIQNGVKNTNEAFYGQVYLEDTVQNGVKHCEDGDWLDGDERFEDIIQNGEKK